MKLELTEPRMHAMALELKAFGGWTLETCHKAVAALIAAADRIPEGAPVGTIARRPDGGWVAHRTVGLDAPFWEYFRLNPNAPALRNLYDADSWPQIRPDQRPSGLDWFPPGEEPLVPRPDLTDHPPREELREYFHKDLAEHCQADDPTAQQEPAEEPPFDPWKWRGPMLEQAWDAAHLEDRKRFPKPARTPRVVDRLGVDEQGSRWQDRQLGEWKFDGQAWRYLELTWTSVLGGEWVEAEPSKRYGPYVEVLS